MTLQFNLIFAVILAGGWLSGRLFRLLRLPSILGMAAFGILCSFFLKPLTPPMLWELAPFLKSFALIVILLRAGLGISRTTLKKVGSTTLLMAFIPCTLEASALTVLFHLFFGFDWYLSGMTGFMLAAVSPAVIVPSMLDLKNRSRGKKNEVPTIVMAGASIDDVYAITLFSVFLGLARFPGGSLARAAISVPVSILCGILSGIIAGFLLSWFFKKHHESIRATEKTLILIVCGTVLVQIGDSLHFAALLGIMTAGFILLERHEAVAHELSQKLSKIWIFAEIILFVLIGFSLDIPTALQSALKGIAVISVGLAFRSAGVMLATAGSRLTIRERLFCVVAYIPKATVQAALGGVALSYGFPEGKAILAVAVVAILFTVPLGPSGIRYFGERLLTDEEADAAEKK